MFARSHVAWLAVGLVVFSLAASAQDEPATEAGTATSSAISKSDFALPRNMFVSLKVVREFFPEPIRQQNAAESSAPLGKALAARTIVYANKDGSRRVLLAVSLYANPSESTLAYQEALRKTQLPEFNPIAVSNVGQQVFGIMTQGTETQVSIYSLDDMLMVTGTLAGYDATTEDISKLVDLTRKEVTEARAHVPARRKR